MDAGISTSALETKVNQRDEINFASILTFLTIFSIFLDKYMISPDTDNTLQSHIAKSILRHFLIFVVYSNQEIYTCVCTIDIFFYIYFLLLPRIIQIFDI